MSVPLVSGDGAIKAPPQHLEIEKPTTALELETALTSLLSNEQQHRIKVVVIDVSKA